MFQIWLPSDQDSSFEFRKNLEKGLVSLRLVLVQGSLILTFGSLIDWIVWHLIVKIQIGSFTWIIFWNMKNMSEMIFISISDGELFFDIVRVCEYTVSVYANIATLNIICQIENSKNSFLYLVLDDIFNFSCIELDCFSNIFRCNSKRFCTKRYDSGQCLHNLFTTFRNDFAFWDVDIVISIDRYH